MASAGKRLPSNAQELPTIPVSIRQRRWEVRLGATSTHQLPQHVRQDSAISIGHKFFRGVDAYDRLNVGDGAVWRGGAHGDGGAGFARRPDADDVVGLAAGQLQRGGGLSVSE